jgi:hypothetical protein
MVDQIAERYGTLPSVVLNKGSTVDLFVYDVAATYRQQAQKKQSGEAPKFTPTELAEKLEKFKNASNSDSKTR